MRFLGYKFTQNALAAGANPLPISGGRFAAGERERREKREERRGKGVLGKGKREGREGKRGGRERGRRREREGRGVCVIGVRGDRRPCSKVII